MADLRSLLTAKEAAEVLAISTRTLWTMTNAGEIPCVRIGRAVRYDPEDLSRWIQKKKRKSTGAITAATVLQSVDPKPATKPKRSRNRAKRLS